MIIKNVSPLGELDVPLLGRFVDYGEEFEVTKEQAERLLPQAENYEPVDDDAKAVLANINGEDEQPADDATEDGDESTGEPEPAPKPTTKRARRTSGS